MNSNSIKLINKAQYHPQVNIILSTLIQELKKAQERKPGEYSGAPGEVACDVCTERKLKAQKSCLVCLASYCETHLGPHTSAGRLKGHRLVAPVDVLNGLVYFDFIDSC